jgi:hypothetical protein
VFFGDRLALRQVQITHLEIFWRHPEKLGRCFFAAKRHNRISLQGRRDRCNGWRSKLITQCIRVGCGQRFGVADVLALVAAEDK